jgi:hypothetical protein
MAALHAYQPEETNPLDQIVRLAEHKSWSVERTTDQEVNMIVSGQWCDLYVSMNWRDDLESLHVAVSYDLKVPAPRRNEVLRLVSLVNGQLFHGHFDQWDQDGTVLYRNSLLLTGGATATDAQCEALLRVSVEYCEAYYPAIQYVCWAGRTARDALDCVMFETVGEA